MAASAVPSSMSHWRYMHSLRAEVKNPRFGCNLRSCWQGLEDAIDVSITHPTWQRTRPDDPEDTHCGWTFANPGGPPFSSPVSLKGYLQGNPLAEDVGAGAGDSCLVRDSWHQPGFSSQSTYVPGAASLF